MNTNTEILTRLSNFRRRQAFEAIDAFRQDAQKNGVAHAITWNGDAAIKAEAVLEILEGFQELWLDAEDPTEYLRGAVADRQRRLSYFDPLSQSSSLASTYATTAEMAGAREAIQVAEELLSELEG